MRSNEINGYEYWIPLIRTTHPIVRSDFLFDTFVNVHLGDANLISRFSFLTNPSLQSLLFIIIPTYSNF